MYTVHVFNELHQLFCNVILAYFDFDLLFVNERNIVLHQKKKKKDIILCGAIPLKI